MLLLLLQLALLPLQHSLLRPVARACIAPRMEPRGRRQSADAARRGCVESISYNRPLSLRAIGPLAAQWLHREMRWLAGDFLLMMEEESLGWVSSAEEIHLIRKAAENFAPAGLQRHLLRRLAEAPPPTAAIANASMASGHEPTVW
eukprot:scaffold88131_cov30-Tisochrysis_lutea.AAC.1